MNPIRAIRGMNDILPDDIALWHELEACARRVLGGYGYREIRPPLVERTELFRRSIGEVTDIVEKEMYTFEDRNGESLALRPECTASCARAAIEHGLLRGRGLRLWYLGPMFRYERPQRGRYRQFYQVGAEAFGLAEPETDAELMLIGARLWRELGLTGLRLEINSLGTREEQSAYRERLVGYLRAHREALDEDSLRRLESNPLRVLDSKDPAVREVLAGAPTIVEMLGAESAAHFARVQEVLREAGVAYRINPHLVRGLDYYTRTVFEWLSGALGAQDAACGGGRYDGLVAEIGGPPTPAVGFSIGLERVLELLRAAGRSGAEERPEVFLAAVGERARRHAHALAERLRDRLAALRLVVDAGEGSFKAKLRRADRSGARLALVLGDSEVESGCIGVKPLRGAGEQRSVAGERIAAVLEEMLAAGEQSRQGTGTDGG